MNFSFSRSRKFILILYFFVYLTSGIYTEIRLMQLKLLPDSFLQDFKYYERALTDALQQKDPYSDRSIGTGFLYPIPSLLIVEVFAQIQDPALQVAVYSGVNIFLMGYIVFGLLKYFKRPQNEIWIGLALVLGFAPFLELLHIGQINVFTLFGISLFIFYENRSNFVSALGLSLAIVTKVTPLLFVGYLVATRKWKLLIYTLVILIILLFISAFRYGFSPIFSYPQVFKGMLDLFPLNHNSQSFLAKIAIINSSVFKTLLSSLPSFVQNLFQSLSDTIIYQPQTLQRILTLYVLSLIVISGLITFIFQQERKSLLILIALGMALTPNILWYHHYVFLLLPMFIWMGWRQSKRITIWCLLGLLIIQIDRYYAPYGLFIHVWGHLTILTVFYQQIKGTLRTSPVLAASSK